MTAANHERALFIFCVYTRTKRINAKWESRDGEDKNVGWERKSSFYNFFIWTNLFVQTKYNMRNYNFK